MKLCNLSTKPLGQSIGVATPIGDALTCRKCVESCPIFIKGRTLSTKLAVFGMHGVEIILWMDWLSNYGASIDCWKKEVVFRPHGYEEFKFCGSRIRATPPLLSTVQARKSVRKGAMVYLAYVVANPKVEMKLEDIMLVCHCLDVFV